MVIEHDILASVPSLLEELVGVHVTTSPTAIAGDSGIDLVLDAGKHRFVVTVKARVSSATLEADVAMRLKPHRNEYEAKRALEVLARDFRDVDHLGPIRATEFSLGIDERDDQIQADAVAAVREFLVAMK